MCEICEMEESVVDALIDKWQDALDCADDYLEKNLISEFLDDLRELRG